MNDDSAPDPATDADLRDGVHGDAHADVADECIDEIAERFLAALQAGATLDRGAIVAQHPDLGERLDRRLKVIERLHRAAADS